MRAIRVVFLLTLFVACEGEPNTVSVTQQEERVQRASAELETETQRLQSLRDSLETKVRQNIDLGMSKERASAVEEALIHVQEALILASESNLKQQREVLALMKTGPR